MRRWLDQAVAKKGGFTIVELLIVIVIIAVLATIVVVGYGAVVNNAHDSSVKSDLQKIDDAFKQFALDSEGTFPNSYIELEGLGVKVAGDSYDTETKANMYLCVNPGATEYAVVAMSRSQKRFVVKSESGISEYTGGVEWDDVDGKWDETCESIDPTYQAANDITGMVDGLWLSWTGAEGAIASINCPNGFIVVPGNATFGTDDFCVMKYEAKNGSGIAISEAAGTPWVSISQTSAISAAAGACTGCHLITEAEWMTIAANIISVGSNWSGGVVGSGALYTGHNDAVPYQALAASSDSDNYSGTGQTSGTQRRTLTLSNGEVIWDISGNVWEWTNATIAANQQPGLSGEATYSYKQWTNPSMIWNGLPALSRPSALGSPASGYTSTQGIGQIVSNLSESTLRGYARGGGWDATTVGAGVLALNLGVGPSGVVGFRVTK